MSEEFGPWASGIGPEERRARWRAMATLALIFAGGKHAMLRACIAAEHDADAAGTAWAALQSLPSLTRRRLLAAYATLAALCRDGE